ncbi:hypothetical protein V1520DRAFT_207379 [Lipomyces starkeyi]
MIHDGLAHACLTNCHCKVFSMCPRITRKFFIISYRSPMRMSEKRITKNGFNSTVGRMLSFSLMSIDCLPRSQAWRSKAMSRLHRWQTDSEQCLRQMSATEIHSTPTGSEYNSSPPIETRQYDLRSRDRCGSDVAPSRTSADSSDSDSNGASSGIMRREEKGV